MTAFSLTRKIELHALAAGAVLFVFYCSCFWGMPFDFTGDLAYIYDTVKSMGFGSLFLETANPLTPAWFFMDEIAHLRPVLFLIYKSLYQFGLLHLEAGLMVAGAGVALLGTALFLVLWRISKSAWFAWLGVLLYGTFPTHVFSMISIMAMDFQFLELFLTLCSILLFWNVINELSGSRKKILLRLAGVIVLTWILIKFKSSAKVLPCIYLTLLGIMAAHCWKRWGKMAFGMVAAVVLALFVLVVPFTGGNPVSAKEQKNKKFNIEYALARTFQSRTDMPFVLWTLKPVVPGSLTEDYGCVMGWVFWGVLTVGMFRRLRRRNRTDEPLGMDDLFWPASIWFLAAVGGFAMGEPPLNANNRYLNYGLLPSVILLFTCLFPAGQERGWFVSERNASAKKTLAVILSGCFLIAIAQNTAQFGLWVREAVGTQWAGVEAEKTVYKMVYGSCPATGEELYHAHWKLRDSAMCIDWEWSAGAGKNAALEKLKGKNKIYCLSRNDDIAWDDAVRLQGVNVRLIRKISYYDAPVAAFIVGKMIKKALGMEGKYSYVYVFELSRPSGRALALQTPPFPARRCVAKDFHKPTLTRCG